MSHGHLRLYPDEMSSLDPPQGTCFQLPVLVIPISGIGTPSLPALELRSQP